MSDDNQLEQAIKILIDVNRQTNRNTRYGQMQDTFAKIEACWDESTSYWDENADCFHDNKGKTVNEGYFQCATTTALLHDIYGGEIMQGEADGRRHYWNRINGIDVDITRRQFEAGTVITDIKCVSKSALITNEWMAERYNNLRDRYYFEEKKAEIYK